MSFNYLKLEKEEKREILSMLNQEERDFLLKKDFFFKDLKEMYFIYLFHHDADEEKLHLLHKIYLNAIVKYIKIIKNGLSKPVRVKYEKSENVIRDMVEYIKMSKEVNLFTKIDDLVQNLYINTMLADIKDLENGKKVDPFEEMPIERIANIVRNEKIHNVYEDELHEKNFYFRLVRHKYYPLSTKECVIGSPNYNLGKDTAEELDRILIYPSNTLDICHALIFSERYLLKRQFPNFFINLLTNKAEMFTFQMGDTLIGYIYKESIVDSKADKTYNRVFADKGVEEIINIVDKLSDLEVYDIFKVSDKDIDSLRRVSNIIKAH